MGADKTLVDAAFREAASRAGANVPDMKPLYDSTGNIGNKIFGAIDSAMDKYVAKKEVGRAGVRKQMAGFQKDANDSVAGMYAQDEPMHDVFVNAFRDKITSLQDEFELYNTYGKGDTSENSMARARIMGELKRVTNQAKNFRSGTEIFLDSIDNVNEGEVNAKDIAGSQQALDFKNYDRLVAEGKISVVYGENGIEITSSGYYGEAGSSWGEEVVSLASLKAKFPQTDLEHHAGIYKTTNDYVAQAGDAANKTNPENDYNEEEANDAFTKQVNTPDKFKNVVSSKIDGLSESSFKVNLENNLSIPFHVLENMYYTEGGDKVAVGEVFKDLDLNGDEIIDAKDLAVGDKKTGDALTMFETNLDAMIDALTNVDNPVFDIGLSSKMLGGYLGEIAKSRYGEKFKKTVKENDKSTPLADQQSIVLGTYMSWESQDMVLDAATNGEAIYDWKTSNEWMPDPDKPGNYRHSISGDVLKGNGESYPLDKLLKGTQFGMSERIKQRKLDYGSGLPDFKIPPPPPPPKTGAETPNIEEFAYNADVNSIKNAWTERYEGMGFKVVYTKGSGINARHTTATITATNGKVHKTKLRWRGGDKETQAKEFNKFIEGNKI